MDLVGESINDEFADEAPPNPGAEYQIRRTTMEQEQEEINQRKARMLTNIIKDITRSDPDTESEYRLETLLPNEELERTGNGIVSRFIDFISREDVLDYIFQIFSKGEDHYDFGLIKFIYNKQFQENETQEGQAKIEREQQERFERQEEETMRLIQQQAIQNNPLMQGVSGGGASGGGASGEGVSGGGVSSGGAYYLQTPNVQPRQHSGLTHDLANVGINNEAMEIVNNQEDLMDIEGGKVKKPRKARNKGKTHVYNI